MTMKLNTSLHKLSVCALIALGLASSPLTASADDDHYRNARHHKQHHYSHYRQHEKRREYGNRYCVRQDIRHTYYRQHDPYAYTSRQYRDDRHYQRPLYFLGWY